MAAILHFIFDLDGTLINSSEGVFNSFRYAFSKRNVQVDEELLKTFIGPPLVETFARYSEFETPMTGVEIYREYYKEKGIHECHLYEGVEEVLCKLQEAGKKIHLATSKTEKYAVQILKDKGLFDYFEGISGATADQRVSHKQDVIEQLLQRNPQIDPNRACMIGDRYHDIKGAHHFGIQSIGAKYGLAPTEDELSKAGANQLIDSPSDILKLLF